MQNGQLNEMEYSYFRKKMESCNNEKIYLFEGLSCFSRYENRFLSSLSLIEMFAFVEQS